MNPLPRTGSYLIDAMLVALRAILFTLAVGLVVLGGVLIIGATVRFSRPYTGSTGVSSLLALLVFAVAVGGPVYLLALRIDATDTTEDHDGPERTDVIDDPDDDGRTESTGRIDESDATDRSDGLDDTERTDELDGPDGTVRYDDHDDYDDTGGSDELDGPDRTAEFDGTDRQRDATTDDDERL